jgi:hypothetical protein
MQMVRIYNRKTCHGTTSKDKTKKAVEEMNDWTLIPHVSKDYSIPYPTLQQYIHRYRDNTSVRVTPNNNSRK